MQTNHPRAKEIAREMGVLICDLNPERTEFEIDCNEEDFSEMLAELEAEGPAKINLNFNREAYDRLQNEGYSDNGTPTDPADEFYAGRE